jgi:hypothetical protein
MFEEKYIKYKNKYLNYKNKYNLKGGATSYQPPFYGPTYYSPGQTAPILNYVARSSPALVYPSYPADGPSQRAPYSSSSPPAPNSQFLSSRNVQYPAVIAQPSISESLSDNHDFDGRLGSTSAYYDQTSIRDDIAGMPSSMHSELPSSLNLNEGQPTLWDELPTLSGFYQKVQDYSHENLIGNNREIYERYKQVIIQGDNMDMDTAEKIVKGIKSEVIDQTYYPKYLLKYIHAATKLMTKLDEMGKDKNGIIQCKVNMKPQATAENKIIKIKKSPDFMYLLILLNVLSYSEIIPKISGLFCDDYFIYIQTDKYTSATIDENNTKDLHNLLSKLYQLDLMWADIDLKNMVRTEKGLRFKNILPNNCFISDGISDRQAGMDPNVYERVNLYCLILSDKNITPVFKYILDNENLLHDEFYHYMSFLSEASNEIYDDKMNEVCGYFMAKFRKLDNRFIDDTIYSKHIALNTQNTKINGKELYDILDKNDNLKDNIDLSQNGFSLLHDVSNVLSKKAVNWYRGNPNDDQTNLADIPKKYYTDDKCLVNHIKDATEKAEIIKDDNTKKKCFFILYLLLRVRLFKIVKLYIIKTINDNPNITSDFIDSLASIVDFMSTEDKYQSFSLKLKEISDKKQ